MVSNIAVFFTDYATDFETFFKKKEWYRLFLLLKNSLVIVEALLLDGKKEKSTGVMGRKNTALMCFMYVFQKDP